MMIVQLTLLDGRKIWANLNQMVTGVEEDRGTKIIFLGGTSITVKEAPEAIRTAVERREAMS